MLVKRIRMLHGGQVLLLWGLAILVVATLVFARVRAATTLEARGRVAASRRNEWLRLAGRSQAEKDSVLRIIQRRDSLRYSLWLRGGPAPPPLPTSEARADSLRGIIVRGANREIPAFQRAADSESQLILELAATEPRPRSTFIFAAAAVLLLIQGVVTWIWLSGSTSMSKVP